MHAGDFSVQVKGNGIADAGGFQDSCIFLQLVGDNGDVRIAHPLLPDKLSDMGTGAVRLCITVFCLEHMNVFRRRQLGMHWPQDAPAYMGKIRVTESKRLLAKEYLMSGSVLLRQRQQPPVGGVGSVKHRVGRGFRILRPQGDPELLCLGKQHL